MLFSLKPTLVLCLFVCIGAYMPSVQRGCVSDPHCSCASNTEVVIQYRVPIYSLVLIKSAKDREMSPQKNVSDARIAPTRSRPRYLYFIT